MIESNINESFPISVTLVDENTSQLISGQTVSYDIRMINDLALTPPINGILSESVVESGIYKKALSIPSAGTYICYITCSGFFTNSEDIVINEESPVDVAKYNLPHNISVTEVVRANSVGTASQIARKVPLGNTDYIMTLVKRDTDSNWDNPVSSGNSYAYYNSIEENLPYMMGGE